MKRKGTYLAILTALLLMASVVASATSSPEVTLASTLLKAASLKHNEYMSSDELKAGFLAMMVLDIGLQNEEFLDAFMASRYFAFAEASKTSLGLFMASGDTMYIAIYDEQKKDIRFSNVKGLKTNQTAAQLDSVMDIMKSMAQIRNFTRIEKVAVMDAIGKFADMGN